MQVMGLIGFGEAGRAFAGHPRWRAATHTFDVKQLDSHSAAEIRSAAATLGVELAGTAAEACARADAVISIVTASQALAVAGDAAGKLARGSFYLDFNSASPETKRAAAAHVETAGGRYVDVAVMSPVLPTGLDVPLLVSGPSAGDAVDVLRGIGFSAVRTVGKTVGAAAATKMIRSILVKGLEALTADCFIAAEAAGVRAEVSASLDASWPGIDWASQADYNFERMMVCGRRRADEMEEVVATIEALGLDSSMSRATAARQRALGGLGVSPPTDLAAKIATLLPLVTQTSARGRNAA